MSQPISRRVFISRLLAVSTAGAALGASGCASKPAAAPPTAAPAATAVPPTIVPTTVPATAIPPTTVLPTAVPPTATTVPPTATAVAKVAAPTATAAPASAAYLAVAKGANADPGEITRRAIAALGGIERFVKKGADVIIKPNVCTAYYGFEYAATTNPRSGRGHRPALPGGRGQTRARDGLPVRRHRPGQL